MNTFAALGDPIRQRIVELLAEGDREAGDLAAQFDVSRPAVSRHLRVLRDAGVVTSREDGRRRVYSLRTESLDEVGRWIAKYRSFWAQRLDALEEHLTKA
ncbi:MAG: winged helix-turn-helix transcriptional regulator [Acidimicrobiia bacterium]|nr:winged helix-turn-helix transcriptional regulator [Acidimicrobiia bacterium]